MSTTNPPAYPDDETKEEETVSDSFTKYDTHIKRIVRAEVSDLDKRVKLLETRLRIMDINNDGYD